MSHTQPPFEFRVPTPAAGPLDSDDLHRVSHPNESFTHPEFAASPPPDALDEKFHRGIQNESITPEAAFWHHDMNFDFVPSTNDEGLLMNSDWPVGAWNPPQVQSPYGLTDYGFADYDAVASQPSPGCPEAQLDLPGLPHPGISPSLLSYTQTVEDEGRAYVPFLDSGRSSFSEHMMGPSSPAIPVPSTSRPSSLPRRRSRYFLSRLGQTASGRQTPQTPSSLDPMQRWQESPPEDEPASLTAIMQAVNKSGGLVEGPSSGTSSPFRHHRRPASLASSKSGTSVSSWQSSASNRSAVSTPRTSQSQPGGARVGKSKRKPRKPSGLDIDRPFCCTFCCDTFKNKFDWCRHEKCLHLNLGGWACTPHGGAVLSAVTGGLHCAYCNCLDPSPEHLDAHNHFQCSDSPRIFRRKDHLVQHLRLVHSMETLPVIDDWKIPGPNITSRCGFCDKPLESWDERADHLTTHFRQGMTMKDWQGDHDFPPEIAAQVMHSLPPYLLSWESQTMVPFSASNKTAQDHLAQISARADWIAATASAQSQDKTSVVPESSLQLAPGGETMVPLHTFTGILTQHLSRFARQQMSLGIIPTDEMFQQESRKLLYDSEDSWNQSIADNPAWISSFRQQLQVQPENSAGRGTDQLEEAVAGFRVG